MIKINNFDINKIILFKSLINFLENDYISAIKNFNSIKNQNYLMI